MARELRERYEAAAREAASSVADPHDAQVHGQFTTYIRDAFADLALEHEAAVECAEEHKSLRDLANSVRCQIEDAYAAARDRIAALERENAELAACVHDGIIVSPEWRNGWVKRARELLRRREERGE